MIHIMEWNIKRDKVTIILVAINVMVFIVLTFMGQTEDGRFMLGKGAMYVPYVLEQGEYYRLVTSMFLHFGIQHLGNNMILLLLVGAQLEEEIGAIKYLIIYIVAGLGGNIISMLGDISSGNYAISGGASGAIFGVIGAMFWVVLRNNGRIGTLTKNGMIFMIGISLYFGFTSSGVDNLAHIGGLVTGLIMSILLYRKSNVKRRTI